MAVSVSFSLSSCQAICKLAMSNARGKGKGDGARKAMAAHTVSINHFSASLSLLHALSLSLSLSVWNLWGRAAQFKLYKSSSSIHGICLILVPPADLGGPIVAQPDAVDLFHNKSIFGNDNI